MLRHEFRQEILKSVLWAKWERSDLAARPIAEQAFQERNQTEGAQYNRTEPEEGNIPIEVKNDASGAKQHQTGNYAPPMETATAGHWRPRGDPLIQFLGGLFGMPGGFRPRRWAFRLGRVLTPDHRRLQPLAATLGAAG